jgi:hypothetical protein
MKDVDVARRVQRKKEALPEDGPIMLEQQHNARITMTAL